MIHVMLQLFPEDEVRFLVNEMEQGLDAARSRNDKKGEAAMHLDLSDANADLNLVVAMTHAQKGLLVSKQIGDRDGQAAAFVRLGNIKLMQSEHEHALEAFKKGGAVLGEVWREGSRERVEIGAAVALGLGQSYLWLERYEEAVHVLNRSLQLHDELADNEGVYDCSNFLAMAYQRLGNVEKATASLVRGVGGDKVTEVEQPDCVAATSSVVNTLFQVARHEDALRAVSIYEGNLLTHIENKDQHEQAKCYWSLGCAYSAIDSLQQAAENFTKCHQLRLLSGDTEGLSSALLRKGLANLSCGDTRAAAEDLDRYLSLIQETTEHNRGVRRPEHSIENECDAAIGLAEAYRNLADITQAADVLKLGMLTSAKGGMRTSAKGGMRASTTGRRMLKRTCLLVPKYKY